MPNITVRDGRAIHINGALAVPTAWPSAQVEPRKRRPSCADGLTVGTGTAARARLAHLACLRSIKSDPSRRTAPPQTLAAAQSLHKP